MSLDTAFPPPFHGSPEIAHLMRTCYASRIMPRTTLDIDAPILEELKKLQKVEGKTLGRLVSDLVAASLPRRTRPEPRPFDWAASSGDLQVDLLDKDAILVLLDAEKVQGTR